MERGIWIFTSEGGNGMMEEVDHFPHAYQKIVFDLAKLHIFMTCHDRHDTICLR